MTFWQVFLLFSALSALCILWPLFVRWKTHKRELRLDHRSDVRDAVQEDREQELKKDHVMGDIDTREFKALKKDLAATIVSDSSIVAGHASRAIVYGPYSRSLLISLCFLLPLASIGAYYGYGAKADWEIRETVIQINAAPHADSKSQRALIDKIRRRLDATPNNGHLWFLLGSTAVGAGDYEEGVRAYRHLNTLYPAESTIIGKLAQALFMRAGATMTPEARQHTSSALALDPLNTTALGLAGIDAYQSGKYHKTIELWQRAIKLMDPRSPDAEVLTQGIAQAQIALKATKGSSGTQSAAANNDRFSLKVTVELGETANDLTGDEVVYIYARAWQGARVPLATQRLTVKDLPVTVLLDKSHAMVAGMDITTASQLEVIARVSKSGDPAPSSGDWMASFGPVILTKPKQKISLNIADQIP